MQMKYKRFVAHDAVLNNFPKTKLLRLDLIKKHHWRIFETSAYTGSNLLESLEWLCTDVSSRVLVPE
jgi:hypothetical protein